MTSSDEPQTILCPEKTRQLSFGMGSLEHVFQEPVRLYLESVGLSPVLAS